MTTAQDTPFLDYAVRWRTGDARPGKHAARALGAGGNFRGLKPFWQVPDARHIDVRRSITDPFDTIMVRQTENRGSIALVLAADLSASMRAAPGMCHLDTLATLAHAASRAAHRAGDNFGFIAFDETIRQDFLLPPTRARGPATHIAQRLPTARATARGAAAIADLTWHLPERRCLVLLVSDFLLPLTLLDTALRRLARHDIAPVVLHGPDPATMPRAGLLRLRDAEDGRTRLVLMRPGVHRRWLQSCATWRAALDGVFARHCRAAFHVQGALDLAALGVHLQ